LTLEFKKGQRVRDKKYNTLMTNTPERSAGQQPTIEAMESVRGKRIKDFSLRTLPGNLDAHQTEQLIIFFTDGSSLIIDTGSNAFNLSRPGLDGSDFMWIFSRL